MCYFDKHPCKKKEKCTTFSFVYAQERTHRRAARRWKRVDGVWTAGGGIQDTHGRESQSDHGSQRASQTARDPPSPQSEEAGLLMTSSLTNI